MRIPIIGEVARDFKQGNGVEAAQGIQDLLSSLQSAVFWGYEAQGEFKDAAIDAISKARRAVLKMERAASKDGK